MHPSVLIKRRAIATNRIVARARALIKQLKLDPALSEALEPKVKDSETADMLRMEVLADLINTLSVMAGAPPEEQPDTAVREFTAEPTPAPETNAAVTAVTPTSTEAEPTPGEDDNPEQVPADEPPTDDVAQPTDEQAETTAVEPEAEVPAEEEAVATEAEPEPPAKPKRKATTKKTSRKGS